MDLIDNYRHIRIFVSSTFQDLEEERNFLMRRTFPKLRDEAAKYGVTISEMDLRWGITEEESKLGRVLQICLEEVDNAIPFFIGIIGKRYGWIPSAKEVNPIVLDTYPQVSSYLDDRISITEMEMRYGVLERKDDVNALFFISEDMPEPDKSEDYEKLINLRNNIIDSRKYPVYKYSNVNEISDTIESYILQFLKDNYTISSENSISDEIYSAYLTAKSNLRTYVSNESYFNTFFEWMQSKSNVLYVVSESGLGKTTLLSSWIASLMEIEEERLIVLPHFVGINKQHISGDNMKESILNQILMFIDENSKRTVNDLGDLDEKLSKAISLLPDQYSIILFIDGINQIPHKDKSNFLKWIWLNGVMPNLKVVVSLTPDDYNTKILKANNAQLLTLTEFNATEKEEFILSYLYYYGKRLNKDSLSLILNSKNSNNTLVLKTLLDAIILFGTYESVNSDIREYVSCESTSELFQLILSSIEREFGDNLVKNVLSYIFVSHDGLTDDELIELCYTIPVVWAQLSRLLKSFICKQSGKYKFPHVIIREVIKKKYHSFDVSGINKYKENLISYFEKEKLSIRSISELPYLYVDIEHYDSLYEYLLNQNVLEYYIHNKPIALSSFWRTLKSANKNYCIIDYIGKIDYGVNDIFPLLGKLCMSYLNDNYAADMFFQENLKHSQETYVYMQSLHDEYGLNESNEAIDHIEIMPDHLSYAGSFCNLGDIKYSEGDYISALMYYHKAVGIITDESQFFDKDYIEERSKHIELFFRKDDEYYRIAYALHRLGNTYDELGNLDIACILYERACQYLSYCETNSDSLLREIFHDWALSMPKNKATEALNLLEYSLNLSYKVGGIQDSNIPKTLSLMGTIYHDYLDDNENAMLCYNKGIEILCSLEDVNDSLGNLYYNRASLHPDISDKISDTKRAIAIYQNNYSLNQLIEGYNGLAIIYYNDKQFIEALRYYLCCYIISYITCGHEHRRTNFFKDEVLEVSQIIALQGFDNLPNEVINYHIIFMHNTSMTKISEYDYEQLLVCLIGDVAKSILDCSDIDLKIELFRKYLITINNIIDFTKEYNRLPAFDSSKIEFLLKQPFDYDCIHEIFIQFVENNIIQDSNHCGMSKTIKWEILCIYYYLKKKRGLYVLSNLFYPVQFAKEANIANDLQKNTSQIIPYLMDVLNTFIYDDFLPNEKYNYALETINLILEIMPNEINFLDTKAEILIRTGNKSEALKIVENILSKDPNYYPSENQFVYNSLLS